MSGATRSWVFSVQRNAGNLIFSMARMARPGLVNERFIDALLEDLSTHGKAKAGGHSSLT